MTHYIWMTQADDRVRDAHQGLHGQRIAWDSEPSDGHPGVSFGCRCYGVPTAKGIAEEAPSFEEFEVAVIDKAALIAVIAYKLEQTRRKLKNLERLSRLPKRKPNLTNTRTWPKPPVKGKLKEGKPSRGKPKDRGEKAFMIKRGENGGIHLEINIITPIGIISRLRKTKAGETCQLMTCLR